MTWVKLDDHFADHPKIEQVGHVAAWLHVAALCYCSRHLTDGFITKATAKRLTHVPQFNRQVRLLVESGLWIEHEDGFNIHDYLEFQPSREEVLAEREKQRLKKARQRANANGRTENGPDGRFMSPGDSTGDDPGESRGLSSATRPVPSRPPTTKGCTDTPVVPYTGDDDGHRIAVEALTIAAHRRHEATTTATTTHGRQKHLDACLQSALTERMEHTLGLIARYPGVTAVDLADLLEPPPTAPNPAPEVRPLPPEVSTLNLGSDSMEEHAAVGRQAIEAIRAGVPRLAS